jgi:hypothetical protein
MKALKLSTLAACIFLFVSSCTKTSDTLSSSSTSTTSSQNAVFGAKAGGQGSEQQGGNQVQSNQPKDLTSITINLNPNPVNQNSNYTVTGMVVFPEAVETGKVVIERAVDANDNYTSVENADDWVQFYVENITSSVTSYTITKTALATEDPGFYGFRLHFIPSGGAGVKSGKSTEVNLEVKRACVSTFTIKGNATAVPVGDGNYEFTITYELTSPVDVTGIKFQGGATSGGQFAHNVTSFGDFVVVNANLQNTVLKWTGDLTACQPKTLTFKYVRKFSCPATDALVTGEWTAKQGETLLADPVHVTYTCSQ